MAPTALTTFLRSKTGVLLFSLLIRCASAVDIFRTVASDFANHDSVEKKFGGAKAASVLQRAAFANEPDSSSRGDTRVCCEPYSDIQARHAEEGTDRHVQTRKSNISNRREGSKEAFFRAVKRRPLSSSMNAAVYGLRTLSELGMQELRSRLGVLQFQAPLPSIRTAPTLAPLDVTTSQRVLQSQTLPPAIQIAAPLETTSAAPLIITASQQATQAPPAVAAPRESSGLVSKLWKLSMYIFLGSLMGAVTLLAFALYIRSPAATVESPSPGQHRLSLISRRQSERSPRQTASVLSEIRAARRTKRLSLQASLPLPTSDVQSSEASPNISPDDREPRPTERR